MFKINFCVVPAFNLVEPVNTSGPGCASIAISAACPMALFLLQATAAMVRTGKAYHNLMVNVVQSNEKLRTRAENIVMDSTGVERDEARATIDKANGNVKLAITMILTETDVEGAEKLLEQAKGHVRVAIKLSKGGNE